MLNYSSNSWRCRFQGKSVWFCPPTPRRNTGSDAESEKVDKVRSALGVCYKPELHFAIGHMRRWDGAYPPLANGTKAVDLLQTDDKKARSVLFAWLCCMNITLARAQVCGAQKRPLVRALVFQVLLRCLCGTAPDPQQEVSSRNRIRNRRAPELSSGRVSLCISII